MKTYLKQRGLSLASVAEELGTSPQNLNGKLKAKSLKSDFISASAQPFRGGWAADFSSNAGSVAGLVAKIE